MYLLMREWGHSGYAAFLSATVFMFSGYIISVINLLASLGSVTWLPLVVLFYERAIKKNRIKNSIIAGIFLAMMILGGGEPAILIGTVFIMLLLGFVRDCPAQAPVRGLASNIKCSRLSLEQGVMRPLVLALLVAAGLTCFQTLPFLEFLRHTSRPGMGFNEASMWSLPPYALLDLFMPYFSESDYLYKNYWTRQSWLLIYYMGIFTLVCAFISLKFDVKKRRQAFFYILALGIVIAFGRYTPIYYLMYKVMPGFELSRYPIKFFFMVAFSLAVLAGMGLDHYRINIFSQKPLGRFLRMFLGIACAGSFLYLILNLDFKRITGFLYSKALSVFPGFSGKEPELFQIIFVGAYNLKRAIGYFIFLGLLMFLPLSRKARLGVVIPVLLCVSILDIFSANKQVYRNMDIGEYSDAGPTVEFLKEDQGLFRTFNSPATIRQNVFIPERDYFEGVRSAKERMASNRNVSFGIYSAYGYGSLYNKRNEKLIEAVVDMDSPDENNILTLLNVKYVISPKDFIAEGYSLAKKGNKANIYKNENVLPRAFLADRIVVIKDETKILERLKSKDFNPAREVILDEDPVLALHIRHYALRENVDIAQYSPGKVIINAQVSASKFLILSDTYYPGWKAYVDGRRAKIYRADYILRAVHLMPGKHTVEFIYDPFSFKLGAGISLLTALLLLIIMVTLSSKRYCKIVC